MKPAKASIVRRGKCLYDNMAEYDVVIVVSDVLYGSGDYEDPPEIAEDREIVCYYAWFNSPANRKDYHTGRGGFLTIEEAMKDVEEFVTVKWEVSK